MVGSENRIAVPDLIGEGKRKRKISPFADQKTIVDDTPNMIFCQMCKGNITHG